MKINILFDFKDGPWGGGNQFLKALRKELTWLGNYEEDPYLADSVLFNSHHFGDLEHSKVVTQIKGNKNRALVFHRLDGPISLVRGSGEEIDQAVFRFNESFADGTIFQSRWIEEESINLGLKPNTNSIVVLNAPDRSIFYRPDNSPIVEGKIKLIATSWSGNIRKGFDVYRWLDDNLDFTRYAMTFVGNSPVEFNNINHKQPMNSVDLAAELRKNHVYITASRFEPCSNSLIEAMHCGLPALAYNNGGNPEIVGKGGKLFTHNDEIIEKLDDIMADYQHYRNGIGLPDIETVTKAYYDFMYRVFIASREGKYHIKKINPVQGNQSRTHPALSLLGGSLHLKGLARLIFNRVKTHLWKG